MSRDNHASSPNPLAGWNVGEHTQESLYMRIYATPVYVYMCLLRHLDATISPPLCDASIKTVSL